MIRRVVITLVGLLLTAYVSIIAVGMWETRQENHRAQQEEFEQERANGRDIERWKNEVNAYESCRSHYSWTPDKSLEDDCGHYPLP